jgi:conjugative relaxase-like TrwC/TraI family protein
MTGEQLTPRQKADRRAGYDFTFSAPKSVSAFYEYLRANGRDEQANTLLDAFTGSVRTTMAELETDMRVRVRAGGAQGDRVTGNFVWAEFTHFQARPVDGFSDPHLHTHAYAMNLTHDGRGWKAGEFGSTKRDATYYQEAFHARLGAALASMGYAVEAARHGFQLAGIERATIDKFSRRTEEVERSASKKGIVYADDKARQGAATRKHKDEGLPPEETRAIFMARLSEEEKITFGRIADGEGSPPGGMTPETALDYALAHSFVRASAIPEKHLLAEALKVGVGSVLPEALQGAAAVRPEIVRGVVRGQVMATTREVLAEEQAMLDFARQGRAQLLPIVHPSREGASGWEFRRSWLSEEQRAAVLHMLGSGDRVIGIRGGAGTGKTAMMQEAVEAVTELTGKAPVVLAPSAEASRGVLREEGFTEADTVATFLLNEKLQARAKNGVIFVDEAGLMGSRTMRALFEVAERQNARVVLQGDVRQHAAVERGDALRLLERKGGVKSAELSTIRRQKPADYREAVARLAEGDVAAGLARLDAIGAVIEVKDEQRHGLLASEYLRVRAGGQSALVIAPTHREGDRVTELIREQLKTRGALTEERKMLQLVPSNWTEAERARAANYAPGQVVAFHLPAKGFLRGERATVLAVEGNTVTVWTEAKELKQLPLATAERFQVFERRELAVAVGETIRMTQNGRDAAGGRLTNGGVYRVEGYTADGSLKVAPEKGGAVRALAKDFGHIAHGYVTTSHASQGKNVDHVFIAQGSESFAASSREQLYVSASRGRLSVKIFTDDKAELARAVERSGERIAATELVADGAEGDAAAKAPKLHERIRAKAVELVRRTLGERFAAREPEGERFGVAVGGWPEREREPAFEPGR